MRLFDQRSNACLTSTGQMRQEVGRRAPMVDLDERIRAVGAALARKADRYLTSII